jgi:hypothetical protein
MPDLQEIIEKRRVGRAKLYRITQTKRDGKPVDAFAASNIVSYFGKPVLST